MYNLANKGINNLKTEDKDFDNLLDWQKIEFMNELVFMIQEFKKKKREEKEKEKNEEENSKKIEIDDNEINIENIENNNIRKTKTLDKKNSNKLMLNNEKKIRKMSNFFSPQKARKKLITEK